MLFCLVVCFMCACSPDAKRNQSTITPTARNQPAVIQAAMARDHMSQVCSVEMVVRASKKERDRKVHYLDSEADYKDPKNFAVVIADEAVDKFAQAGIENPAAYYKDKKIRVTGKIVFQEDQYQIVATEPSQIQIVTESK